MNVIALDIEEPKNNAAVCTVSGKGRLYYAVMENWGDYGRTTFKIAIVVDGKRYAVNSEQDYPNHIGYLAKEAIVCKVYSGGMHLYPVGFVQARSNKTYVDLGNHSDLFYITDSNANTAQQDKVLMSQTALTFNESLIVEISASDGGTGSSGQTLCDSALVNIMYSLEE